MLYAEPNEVDKMTRTLEQGLFDEAWREKAMVGGLQRAAGFSWQRCAEDTASAYQLALMDRK